MNLLEHKILQKIKPIERFGLALKPFDKTRGYIGVSICSHFYSRKNVNALIQWAANNFDEFLFLIADEPHSYTFMSSKGLNYNNSYERAMKIGDEKYASIKRLIQNSKYHNISIARWQDIAHNEEYLNVQRKIKEYYQSNSNFREDILEQVILRNEHLLSDGGLSIINESKFDTAALYVLNEISIMVYLQEISEKPFPIQVSPFRMPTALIDLYENINCNGIKLKKNKSGYIQIDVEEE